MICVFLLLCGDKGAAGGFFIFMSAAYAVHMNFCRGTTLVAVVISAAVHIAGNRVIHLTQSLRSFALHFLSFLS